MDVAPSSGYLHGLTSKRCGLEAPSVAGADMKLSAHPRLRSERNTTSLKCGATLAASSSEDNLAAGSDDDNASDYIASSKDTIHGRENLQGIMTRADGGRRDLSESSAALGLSEALSFGGVQKSAGGGQRQQNDADAAGSGDVDPGVTDNPRFPRDSNQGSAASALEASEQALARLYEIHDAFHSADKSEKQSLLRAKADDVFEALSRVETVPDVRQRSRLSFIRGRTLDAFAEFDMEAERCLARARCAQISLEYPRCCADDAIAKVKLQPADPHAWSALGHCFWKKKDLLAAKRCFTEALARGRTPESLCHLSMLLRQFSAPMEEAGDNLQESLRLGKEAVALDMDNGKAWYVLGNAYVAFFFRASRSIKDLDRALQAYKKAEAKGGERNPDLFFNRAQVLHFREDYCEAVRDYRTARKLDPLLPVEGALHSIETGVERLATLVHKQGGLKPKRVGQITASLRTECSRRDFGTSYVLASLKELNLGDNSGSAIVLKLVMPTMKSCQPPERMMVMDIDGNCAVLSLYSITKDACAKIQPKDIIVVKHPRLRTIALESSLSPAIPEQSVTTVTRPLANTDRSRSAAAMSACLAPASEGDGVARSASASFSRQASGRYESGSSSLPQGKEGSPVSFAYPGIQADLGDVMVNGKSMQASSVPPALHLAIFDK